MTSAENADWGTLLATCQGLGLCGDELTPAESPAGGEVATGISIGRPPRDCVVIHLMNPPLLSCPNDC